MIRTFETYRPKVADSAWVDATALVIGEVELGEDASVWPMTVVRGDVNWIRVGPRTNIQDGSVVHVAHAGGMNPTGYPTVIGADVTVGHKAIVHACTIEDACLIGMGATIMDGAVLGAESMLGAGALVPPGKELPGGYLYVGSPAKAVRELTEDERDFLRYSAAHYVKVKDRHRGAV
ncbi:gamma carbonic anhydrase family protein [Aquisalimonas sp. 2447]|uniref:gamma carbonic anhydrase family protein n=1 Tax=Aquisalimonas sp. 2447 TaxID=2740807 RepID=UPI0014324CFE|nr:gamma carbonic anhydrase family protein [Aquisalimonas sp. 2447]QIT53897.1 gamma carbonic anhydrase family protein [Aquisalimonas sp. 2447]